jgi:predicted transcriptional regulator
MTIGKYLYNRMKLLDAINEKGYCTPISVLSSTIFANGSSLATITKELEDLGLIISVKSNFIQTYLTAKGENALKLLKELNKIWK